MAKRAGKASKAAEANSEWLFEGEEVIHGWSGITVTTHRVCHEMAGSGEQAIVSLVLGKIDGTAFRRVHSPWLLALAVLFGLLGVAGLMMRDGLGLVLIGTLIALFLVAVYFTTRQVLVIVSAGDMKIKQVVQGGEAHAEEARALLRAIDEGCTNLEGIKRGAGARAA